MTEVIGQGGYGCVHKPPLQCEEDGVDYSNSVSKILNDQDADDEMREFEAIETVDPNHKFHLGKPVRCKPAATLENLQAVQKCKDQTYGKSKRKLFDDNALADNLSLFIMKDGGPDLFHLAPHLQDTPLNEVEDFWIEAHRLFVAIIQVASKGYVLVDVKPENIVYNPVRKRIAFIDFGLMRSREYLMEAPRSPHWSYPVECHFYNNPAADTTYDLLWRDSNLKSRIMQKKGNHYFPDDFLNAVLPVHPYPDEEFTEKGVLRRLKNDLKELARNARNTPYAEFYKKSLDTFDLYGLGMSLLEAWKFSRVLETGVLDYKTLQRFLYACITPNLAERLTMDEALDAYEDLLQPLLTQRSLEIIDHEIIGTGETESSTDKIDHDLVMKTCPPGKRLNRANRCIKIPVPKCPSWKQWNEDRTKCVTIQNCKDFQELSRHTKRCVKRCTPHQDRYIDLYPDTVKNKNRCVTVRCPPGKFMNHKTKRCNKVRGSSF